MDEMLPNEKEMVDRIITILENEEFKIEENGNNIKLFTDNYTYVLNKNVLNVYNIRNNNVFSSTLNIEYLNKIKNII